MMCCCTLWDAGLWDVSKIIVEAIIYLDDEFYKEHLPKFILPSTKGIYQIMVTTFDPQTNNTDLHKTAQIVK